MRRVLLFLLLAAALAGLAAAPGGRAADSEIEKEILALEEAQNQAFVKGDADALDRIYADELAWTNQNGELLTKAQILADIRSGKQKYNSVRHDDVRLHVYGNTVVATGHSTSSVIYKGQAVSRPRRFTNVYVNQNGQWRLVVHHVTPIAEQ
jgi:ketosteroid isomerase-like protein